eukprot:scaffold24954_cov108-Cylindrotheca_fusiformis.AAC.1
MKFKRYGQLSEAKDATGNAVGDKAGEGANDGDSLRRSSRDDLDKKIEESMRSIRQMQSMRQLGIHSTNSGTTPSRPQSHRQLGDSGKPTDGGNIPKTSVRPSLSRPLEKSPPPAPVSRRPGLKGHRAQSCRFSLNQSKSSRALMGGSKRRSETGLRHSSLHGADTALPKDTTRTRPSVRAASQRSTMNTRKNKRSKDSKKKKKKPLAASELTNVSWKRENPRTVTKQRPAQEKPEGDFADFGHFPSQQPNVAEEVAKPRGPQEKQELDFADFGTFPSQQTKTTEDAEAKEMGFAEFANLSWSGLNAETEETEKRESASKATRRSPKDKEEETLKAPKADTEVLSPEATRAKPVRRNYTRSPSARRLSSSREALQTPSQRRKAVTRNELMVSSSSRSMRKLPLSSEGRRNSLGSPAVPATPPTPVATTEFVNKQGIGEIAKLLERSKRVHAENQEQEEQKRNARLAKIRARRRRKQRSSSPEETSWVRNPSVGLSAIPTM